MHVFSTADEALEALEAAAFILAHRHRSRFERLEVDEGLTGAEYRPGGVVALGYDVWEIIQSGVAFEDPGDWIEAGRIICHEIFHGVSPRGAGAVEEAAVETLGRGHAIDLLELAGVRAPGGGWPAVDGAYRPQVRWLERLADWLDLPPIELARTIKHGRRCDDEDWRQAERLQWRALARCICAHRGLRPGSRRQNLFARVIGESAGAVCIGAYTAPRSPVRALSRALADDAMTPDASGSRRR
ncbi:hypothetical protein [Miltoncostaea oceani]|uniref:hypothetical protein n=1 Tax=Miltoncostaea oceani TaxID=2843216 RepID=UPI001C3DBB26|nr:hypothetical protein [Miltoncostaea oceani]